LISVRNRQEDQIENCVDFIAKTKRMKTASSLFSIDRRFPKLDVAFSTL
jgi:hypothetical protein